MYTIVNRMRETTIKKEKKRQKNVCFFCSRMYTHNSSGVCDSSETTAITNFYLRFHIITACNIFFCFFISLLFIL